MRFACKRDLTITATNLLADRDPLRIGFVETGHARERRGRSSGGDDTLAALLFACEAISRGEILPVPTERNPMDSDLISALEATGGVAQAVFSPLTRAAI